MDYIKRKFTKASRMLYSKIFPSRKNWKEQDYKMFRFYSGFVRRKDFCFDIGANVGNRTRVFLELGTNVVAVEPQGSCVAELHRIKNKRLHIVQKAVGAFEGVTELFVSDASVLSTVSLDWINAVKQSGRFVNRTWERKQTVEMTTLDCLIKGFGIPSFIKIDVEGFELEVLKGLSQPVPALSFEFTPEIIDTAVDCVHYLASLDERVLFNYSLNESMELVFKDWVPSRDVISALRVHRNDLKVFGDVYAKFPGKQ